MKNTTLTYAEEMERRRLRHLETNHLWRKAHPDRVKAQTARYRTKYRQKLREQGQERYALYGKPRTVRQNILLIKWRYDNWEKVLAQCKLQRAVKSGRVLKPSRCNECGKEKRLHGHHDDYSKPLAVKWLCSSCHKLLHLSVDKNNGA